MKDLALGNDGDLTNGEVTSEQQVVQACKIALQRFMGELELYPSDGARWPIIKQTDLQLFSAEATRIIKSVAGVKDCKNAQARLDRARNLNITCTINGMEVEIK